MREHTIVIGAGFAGLVAARELHWQGYPVTVLEARERIGGRTWTDSRLGLELELGGTWVHWMQPHVWSEIRRYKRQVVASPLPREAYWISEGQLHRGTVEQLDATLRPAQQVMFEGAMELFPRPYELTHVFDDPAADPALRARFERIDREPLLASLHGFTQQQRDLIDSYWSGGFCGSTQTASPMMVKRWAALADASPRLLDDCTLLYKLEGGMRGLYEAIAAELPPDTVQLNRAVAAIEHDEGGVHVKLADGELISGGGVIVTAPVGALRNITFAPALPADAAALIGEGLNSTGCKVWAKVRGEHSLLALAPRGYPLNLVRSEYSTADGNTVLVGFGADHAKLALEDPEQVRAALAHWLPDVQVLACAGHDWVADPWSQQTWATFRHGQLSGAWRTLRAGTPRLHFAGADYASGWNSFVDGAIESGIEHARALITRYRS